MPTQDSILGPISGNEGKKKATGRNAKGEKRVRSAEKDMYNALLELVIEEENKNASYAQSSEKEDGDHYSTIEDNPPPHSTYMPKTPSHNPLSPLEPFTPTKSKSLLTFESVVIIDSPKNRGSLKPYLG